MIPLPIDLTSAEYARLKSYVAARRAEILETLVDLQIEDRERRDAAVRIDELATLLDAPVQTLADTKAAHEAAQAPPRRIY